MSMLFEVRNLNVTNSNVKILKNISFEVDKGEILGIIGESGCGKSTLLRAITKMTGETEKITHGRVKFNDMSISDLSEEEIQKIRGRDIGFVFQNPASTMNPLIKIGKQFIEAINVHKKMNKKDCFRYAEELLKKLNNGDEKIRSTLIERNLRLVVYIARKFENTGVYVEDLISVGTIGLIKAVNTFNPEKKIKLATYASRCIENEILMYLRRNSKVKAEISFYEPLNIDWDGNELLLSDILGTENDTVYNLIEDEVDKQLLFMALKSLNDREKEIVRLRFGLNGAREKTQKEVADMLGISQSYISRLEKKIIKRLKKEINRMI